MSELTKAIAMLSNAKETLDTRTKEQDDTQLIDAHDDICNALEILNNIQEAQRWKHKR